MPSDAKISLVGMGRRAGYFFQGILLKTAAEVAAAGFGILATSSGRGVGNGTIGAGAAGAGGRPTASVTSRTNSAARAWWLSFQDGMAWVSAGGG